MSVHLLHVSAVKVSKEKDKMVEKEFNHLLDSASYLAHQLEVDHVNGRPLSLGRALDIIIQLQEEEVRKKCKEHLKTIVKVQEEVFEIKQQISDVKDQIKKAHSSQEEVVTAVGFPTSEDILSEDNQRTLVQLFRVYDGLVDHLHELEVKLSKLEAEKPPTMYMSAVDRQLLNWHFANLEFANAAPLKSLSLKHWDQDDDFEFTGCHLAMREGYCKLPELLADGLDVRFSNAVNKVHYSSEGVEVHALSTETGESQIFRGDVALVTVPLGVLKSGKVSFHPPLPEWKKQAIRKLGFGLLNKVVLCFEERFWDSSVHLFGHVASSPAARGEFFLFWYLSEAPVLIALVAGEDAEKFEAFPDQVILAKVLAVLRSVFGDKAVPEPKHFMATRWRSDEHACGSYSYVAAGSSGNDYDFLAAPICPVSQGVGMSQSRVFFAGEHTIKNYPATVHGAMLSGLREAGKIGDALLGAPHTPRPLAGETFQGGTIGDITF
jgi:lysine-specific histone demethylase 1